MLIDTNLVRKLKVQLTLLAELKVTLEASLSSIDPKSDERVQRALTDITCASRRANDDANRLLEEV